MRKRSTAKSAVVATASAVRVDSWPWRRIVASEYGPASATTRAVLHVLALHMNPSGGDCWPTQTTIAKRSGLTLRAVKLHIAIARRTFWLGVHATDLRSPPQLSLWRSSPGQAWHRNSYVATVPAAVLPLVESLKSDSAPRAPSQDHGAPGAPSRGTTCTQEVHQVPPILFLKVDPLIVQRGARPKAVDNSAGRAARERPRTKRPDDLKNRSPEKKSGALRARIAGATRAMPTRLSPTTPHHELTDAELAAKVRKLRAIGQGDGDIRRALGSQASAAQLTRVLKSLAA